MSEFKKWDHNTAAWFDIRGMRLHLDECYAEIDRLARPQPEAIGRPKELEKWTLLERECFNKPLTREEIASMLEVCRITIHEGSDFRRTLETTTWMLARLCVAALESRCRNEGGERRQKIQFVPVDAFDHIDQIPTPAEIAALVRERDQWRLRAEMAVGLKTPTEDDKEWAKQALDKLKDSK